MNPSVLPDRLPKVSIVAGARAVERMEFVDKKYGKRIIGYVAGWCSVDVGPALVYGDSAGNTGVHNSKGLTTISVFPIECMQSYVVLSPDERAN